MNIDSHKNRADDWIQKIIKADKRDNFRFFLGQDYALYAELHKRNGNQAKAKEHLSKAVKIYQECGANGWFEKYKNELAEL